MPPIKKAVIPAAGFGTRLLPQTKAMPKFILPIIDKPIIQYIVEELVEAGVTEIIVVAKPDGRRSFESHFGKPSQDLIAHLKKEGPAKEPYIKMVEDISNLARFTYVERHGPYGNAGAVVNAEEAVGDEPFLYIYPDDVFVASPSRAKQMVEAYSANPGIIHACIEISKDDEFSRYGVVGGQEIEPDLIKMDAIIEKPGGEKAPSNMASIGGYVLTKEIFPYLHDHLDNFDGRGEFKIQDVMQKYIKDGKPMYGVKLKDAKYYDTGNKLEYLKTVIEFGLAHPDFSDELKDYLRKII